MKTVIRKFLSFGAVLAVSMSALVVTASAAGLAPEESVKAQDYIQVDVTATKDTGENEWVVGAYRMGDIDYTTPAEGDVYLEYTVQVLNQVQGIGHIDFFSGANARQWWLDLNAPAADQNGILAGRVDLSTTRDAQDQVTGDGPAYKQWYYRKIKFENNYKLDTIFVQTWIPGGVLKKDETVTMLYKDIRFVDGDGKVLFNFFTDYLDRDYKGNINNFDMSMSNGFGLNATARGYYVHAQEYEAGKAVDVELPATDEYATTYTVEKEPANGTAVVSRKGEETLEHGMDTLTYTPKADFKGYDEVVLKPGYYNKEDPEEKVGSATGTLSEMSYKFVFYAKDTGTSGGDESDGDKDDDKTPPATGDAMPAVVVSAAVLSAVSLAAVMMKKKRA